jgi:hypothetical protein
VGESELSTTKQPKIKLSMAFLFPFVSSLSVWLVIKEYTIGKSLSRLNYKKRKKRKNPKR